MIHLIHFIQIVDFCGWVLLEWLGISLLEVHIYYTQIKIGGVVCKFSHLFSLLIYAALPLSEINPTTSDLFSSRGGIFSAVVSGTWSFN